LKIIILNLRSSPICSVSRCWGREVRVGLIKEY